MDVGINVVPDYNNIAIHNGTVSDWGAQGIYTYESLHTQIWDVRVIDNGEQGMRLGEASLVYHCLATGNSTGISAYLDSQVTDCVASQNKSNGINVSNYSRETL